MYIIEGNIGAGKTTFLQIIGQELPNVKIVDEPLDAWNNKKHGQSLLANFYQDTPRWAFTMEMFTLMCRVQEHIKEQKNIYQRVVMERSIYSGYYCFALNSYKQGFMDKLEWEIHKRWFNYLVKDSCKNPQGFIYLKTSAEVAYQRTQKRNREGEETIPLSYFQQIEDRLEKFLIKKRNLLPEHKNIPVLVIDCDQEFANNASRRKKMLQLVEDFFAQTKPIENKETFSSAEKTSFTNSSPLFCKTDKNN
ncbi:deoxynucleoside kinase [bacterium]|nr:deoxynucleoside kinase [bacterium]